MSKFDLYFMIIQLLMESLQKTNFKKMFLYKRVLWLIIFKVTELLTSVLHLKKNSCATNEWRQGGGSLIQRERRKYKQSTVVFVSKFQPSPTLLLGEYSQK